MVETVCRLDSITGVSDVTSTFSAIPPTLIVTPSGTMEPALTGTFSFRMSVNPASFAVTM